MTTPSQHEAASSNTPLSHEDEAHVSTLSSVNKFFSHMSIVNPSAHLPLFYQHIEAVFAQSPRRYALIYMDDILVFSATVEQHASDLHDVLVIVSHLGVIFDSGNCVFFDSKRLLGQGGEVTGDEDVLAGEE